MSWPGAQMSTRVQPPAPSVTADRGSVNSTANSPPEEQFAALADRLGRIAGVAAPGESGGRGFGSDAYKIDGSIFAMLMGQRLVVKLPRARVAELIEAGTGAPFGGGKGTPMKEWLTVTTEDPSTWLELATEALAFVGGR